MVHWLNPANFLATCRLNCWAGLATLPHLTRLGFRGTAVALENPKIDWVNIFGEAVEDGGEVVVGRWWWEEGSEGSKGTKGWDKGHGGGGGGVVGGVKEAPAGAEGGAGGERGVCSADTVASADMSMGHVDQEQQQQQEQGQHELRVNTGGSGSGQQRRQQQQQEEQVKQQRQQGAFPQAHIGTAAAAAEQGLGGPSTAAAAAAAARVKALNPFPTGWCRDGGPGDKVTTSYTLVTESELQQAAWDVDCTAFPEMCSATEGLGWGGGEVGRPEPHLNFLATMTSLGEPMMTN